MITFKGNLYAGTNNWNSNTDQSDGGQVWRSSNGINWEKISLPGFTSIQSGIAHFAVLNDQIYAVTDSVTDTDGFEIWHSSTGDSGDWERVISNGFGTFSNSIAGDFRVFNGYLYVGTYNVDCVVSPDCNALGGQVWRSQDGASWDQVNVNGFGNTADYYMRSFAILNDYLYVGASNGDQTGGKIWRCQTCDGSDWQPVVGNGFGNMNNDAISLATFNDKLYAVAANYTTGGQVWQTADGSSWVQVGWDGLGDSNNIAAYRGKSMTVFNNNLWIGMSGSPSGVEVWQYLDKRVLLPLIMR